MEPDPEQVAEVEAMFALKGFGISVNEKDAPPQVPASAASARNRFWVDLTTLRNGEVVHPNYGSGPTRTLAIIATEQRWLSEQEGAGASAGTTYVEKALARLRDWPGKSDENQSGR